MNWQLIVDDGPDQGTTAALVKGQILVGRDPATCDLVLSDNTASRNHARLQIAADGTFQIEDLNSSNGTFINDQPITGIVRISPEDQILIGANRLKLSWSDQGMSNRYQGYHKEGRSIDRKDISPYLSISQAMAIPFSSQGFLKWLLGGFLSMIPVFSFFSEGYRYRIFQNGTKNNIEMPEWNEWGELFIKGLLFFAIKLIYLLIPLLFFLFALLIFYFVPNSLSSLLLATVFVVIIYSIFYFFLPMGLANFASTGDFFRAFQIKAVIQTIKANLSQYLLIIIIFFGLWIVSAAFYFIPYIGWLFSVFGIYYTYIEPFPLFDKA
jgi:hypothetical protein